MIITKLDPGCYEISVRNPETENIAIGYVGLTDRMDLDADMSYGKWIGWIPATDERFQSDSFNNVYKALRFHLRWYAWDPTAMLPICKA